MATTEQVVSSSETERPTKDLAGKYLTFGLGHEVYGIPILTVVEIIQMMQTTAVPRTPDFVRGVINLRGAVIPVVDLRGKLGMAHAEDTGETCIVVVRVETVSIGVVIDRVSEVLDVKAESIEPPPEFGTDCNTDFILGMARTAEGVKILIDICKILSVEELNAVKSIS